MDHTPITLPSRASLALAASLFQKLGLRYILFATHGLLQGLLTKKDVFFVLNSEAPEGSVVGTADGRRLEERERAGHNEAARLLGRASSSDVDSFAGDADSFVEGDPDRAF
jgi:chloride channel 3/4/5